jgi:putative acetyltransferase
MDHGDARAVLSVVRAAFFSDTHNARQELRILTTTWNCHAIPPGLELVAVVEDGVVGHVVAGAGLLRGPSGKGAVCLGIAPLSVHPDWQRRGVGTALMDELLARARTRDWPLACLLGDPTYYKRFGFEPASDFGVSCRGTTPDDPHFMISRLLAGRVHDIGEFSYCWELYPDGRDVYRPGELPGYCSKPIRMMCEYGADVPLFPQSRFVESLVPPDLLEKLRAWQAIFDANCDPYDRWSSAAAKEHWEHMARELGPELRAALAGKAEVRMRP